MRWKISNNQFWVEFGINQAQFCVSCLFNELFQVGFIIKKLVCSLASVSTFWNSKKPFKASNIFLVVLNGVSHLNISRSPAIALLAHWSWIYRNSLHSVGAGYEMEIRMWQANWLRCDDVQRHFSELLLGAALPNPGQLFQASSWLHIKQWQIIDQTFHHSETF